MNNLIDFSRQMEKIKMSGYISQLDTSLKGMNENQETFLELMDKKQKTFLREITGKNQYNKNQIYEDFSNKLDNSLQNGEGGIHFFYLSSMDVLARSELAILKTVAKKRGIHFHFQKGSVYASYLKTFIPDANQVLISFGQTQE